ncbi:MAG: outer membrane lipoprotein carrier protein LolA [Deltaproteobacteria bacterium]|nr:outer membrane lipoprotein carrier protein LolA [Deltaproteobacteria bacterium]
MTTARAATATAAATLLLSTLGVASLGAHEGHSAPPATSAPRPAAAAATANGAEACPSPAVAALRLQARYDATKNFRADFRQATTVAALSQGDEAFGNVVFMKPGRMHWEFQTPQRQSMVADGTTLWIYQPTDRQVLKAPFDAAFVSTTPISFLAGVGRIKDDFQIEQDPRGCNAQRIYLKLVPKNAQDVGSLTLAVLRSTYDIVEATVTDPVGNVTTLSFSNVQRNVDLPDDEFRFAVPEGVDVIAAPRGAAAP